MAHVPGRVTRAAKAAQEKVGSSYSTAAVVALECERSSWRGLPGHCRWCNRALEGRRHAWCSDRCHLTFERNHIWSEAKEHVLQKAHRTCEREGCSVKKDLQVNHIDPVVGRGYRPSCFHHLDNLEALCRPHHQLETNAQRAHRQLHWIDGALSGSVTLPAHELDEELRQDLVKRMLSRRSGWPFILPTDNFAADGAYHRYRPNTAWATALEDLQQAYPTAKIWDIEKQAWMSVRSYSPPRQCAAKAASGVRCGRRTFTVRCWQHPLPMGSH